MYLFIYIVKILKNIENILRKRSADSSRLVKLCKGYLRINPRFQSTGRKVIGFSVVISYNYPRLSRPKKVIKNEL